MTVLVTGAAGYIGRALTHALVSAGHTVVPVTRADGDIASAAPLEAHVDAGIAHVFHLAGASGIQPSWADVAGFVSTNVVGTTRVAEFCRRTGSALTFISSYMYGMPAYLPIDEAHPVANANPYALSKRLAEEVVLFYAREFGVRATIIRPFGLYGPGQPASFLVPVIVGQVCDSDRVEVNDLHPSKRDYLFIGDFVDALVRTLEPPPGSRVFNIGSGQGHTVEEVIGITQRLAGTDKPVVSRGLRRQNEYPDIVADVSRAEAELGWVPTTTLEGGLAACLSAHRHR